LVEISLSENERNLSKIYITFYENLDLILVNLSLNGNILIRNLNISPIRIDEIFYIVQRIDIGANRIANKNVKGFLILLLEKF
jgi:hypothetical protein